MDGFINFLVNNYLIFLLISLILIFALVGYLVDSKKKINNNSNDEEPKNENVIPEDVQEQLKNMKAVSLTDAVSDLKMDAPEVLQKEILTTTLEPEKIEINIPPYNTAPSEPVISGIDETPAITDSTPIIESENK